MTINTLTLIEAELKAALASVAGSWPVRWPNELWPASIAQNEDARPIYPDGSPRPFMEAEVIAGADIADIAPAGSRHSTREGLFRVYLIIGQGVGTTDITLQADQIANYFKRFTVYLDPVSGTRLTTMDFRIDDGVATYEDGDRFVRMMSALFSLDYVS